MKQCFLLLVIFAATCNYSQVTRPAQNPDPRLGVYYHVFNQALVCEDESSAISALNYIIAEEGIKRLIETLSTGDQPGSCSLSVI